MLMKVEAEGLDRGTRIAIGHKAKSAIKAAGMLLPEAVLKRPRKPKAEPVQEAPKEDHSGKTVKELRQLCKDRGIKGHSRDGITKADLLRLACPARVAHSGLGAEHTHHERHAEDERARHQDLIAQAHQAPRRLSRSALVMPSLEWPLMPRPLQS